MRGGLTPCRQLRPVWRHWYNPVTWVDPEGVVGGAHTLVGGGGSDLGSICSIWSANFLIGLGGHVPPSPPPGSAPGLV